jgi:hypothetical protein
LFNLNALETSKTDNPDWATIKLVLDSEKIGITYPALIYSLVNYDPIDAYKSLLQKDIKQLKLSGSVTSIQLNCRANWYRNTPNTGTGIVQIQMKAYSGGTMISDGNYGFITSGGTQVGTTYTFADSTILISNAACSGTDCVGFFTYTLSTGTFVKSNTCIP